MRVGLGEGVADLVAVAVDVGFLVEVLVGTEV